MKAAAATVWSRCASSEAGVKVRTAGWGVVFALAIALAGGVPRHAHAAANATLAAAPNASSLRGPVASSALRFAWLRDGGARLWTFDPTAEAGAPGPGTLLPPTLDTQLGSVWKLFVYAYLVEVGS